MQTLLPDNRTNLTEVCGIAGEGLSGYSFPSKKDISFKALHIETRGSGKIDF